MLEKLKINNVALIKSLEINFSSGFNVVLGETGAGKSIIFDALNFVLGEKADKTLIRAGEESMKVSAIFSSPSSAACKILSSYDIPCDEEIFISRTYSTSGKGDVKINGEIAPLSMLKQLGEALVDSYGQNEGVSLLKQKNHLSLLDSYKPNQPLFHEAEELIQRLNNVTKEIQALGGSEANRERQIDLLKYQIDEIEKADLKAGEDTLLNERLLKLSNFEKISEAIASSEEYLNSENGSLSLLRGAISSLKSVEKYDEKVSEILTSLEEGLANLEGASDGLFSLSEDYVLDENSIDKLIERKDSLDNLKRKYGSTIEDVLAYLQSASEELIKLENAEEILKEKEEEKQNLLIQAEKKLLELEQYRRKCATELEEKIENGLGELGIEKAKFKINFIKLYDSIFDVSSYSINCLEDVEFLFSANFGEQLKPLAKTISGGELSRFMLVFKNIIASQNSSQTLILDEVDSGISGKIANAVAKKIAKLSKSFQLLCITHLPQVAAMGDSFFLVSKSEKDGRTETEAKQLSSEQICQEIAKLTYGSYDDKKLELTQELLESNSKFKATIE